MTPLLLLVRRSLRQHAFSTGLTAVSIALAGGLVMAIFALKTQSEEAFTGERLGFDGVLGARSSPLQLVLNAVFHLEVSPGNIPWKLYESVREDPAVSLAIPYALGDNYHGFRLVGTTSELFTDLTFSDGGRFTLQEGDFFDAGRREAVVGSFAAQETGLKPGDPINPFHGLAFDPSAQHPEEYIVVGILNPTNSPADRVIWIPIEGIFRMEGHVLRGSGDIYTPQAGTPIPLEHKEVSAVMIKVESPAQGFALAQTINRQGTVATLAYPVGSVMADLFNKIGWIVLVLELVAYLVVVVAAASLTAALYNTLNERRRDIAILRALGARRGLIFQTLLLEAAAIGAMGGALSFAVYAAIVLGAREVLRAEVGILVTPFSWHPALVAVPLAMILLGALSGFLPAYKAFRTDVAKNLTPTT